ncbi:ABC transporter permease [Actinosynnema sp. NPDC047251]|uniref:ABC-type dipeptide transporter, permease subunit n=1 Tax=Saccharothrix espanaensis (strain ATCC 51144 / DSM 44229 / JCM 9112 / NBRC 15066 / NRRL 15764) TaxID=1179773 RepID=K0K572_SACES|nr:ABC transporter permease [Saccharothrix espanaensis]CCH32009.1 ABC-type dipeptide transporter, permease subunit [Saccharothrix espanaensis DSM 44229]
MRRIPRAAVLTSGAVVVVLALAAVAPGWFTAASPIDPAPVDALLPPGAGHWFGTDELGRDVFARVVHGARSSLSVGLGAILIAVTVGALLGITAALGGTATDTALMRLADVLLSLPELMLALLVITVLGAGPGNTMIAIAVALVPGYARMVRAEALVVRRSGYVEAAVGLGLPRAVLIARHVLPNALGPLLVLATIGFGTAIIAVSGLSFLGLGARPPEPEWGSMLSSGRKLLAVAWWTAVFPGAAITVAVVSVNVVGRRLQAAFTRRTSG